MCLFPSFSFLKSQAVAAKKKELAAQEFSKGGIPDP
jgi:hypothetical protein